MTAVRLLVLSATGEPSPWLIASGGGEVLERGLARAGDPEPQEPLPTVVLVPGHGVLIRQLPVPGRTDAQARAAAAWLLRDDLGQAPERTRTVVGPPLADGRRLAAVTAVGVIEAWIAEVESLGMRAAVILPDSLLLAAPAEHEEPTAIRWGDRLLVRDHDYAFSVEHEMSDVVLAGRSPRHITEPERIEALMVQAALNPALNLLAENPGAPSRRPWLRTAVLAGVLALTPGLHLGLVGARDELAARRLEATSLAAVRAARPDIAPNAAPLEEVRRLADRASVPGGAVSAVALLAHALEPVPSARLEALTLEDGRVAAVVSYGSPSDLEAVRSAMSARGVQVEIEGASSEGGRIISDIRLGSRS